MIPHFSSQAPAGISCQPINLGLNAPPADVAGPITVTVTGTSDWSLSQGSQNADGSWSIQTNNPSALTVTTTANFAGAMVLNVSESWTNSDGTLGTAAISDNVEAYPASPIFAVSSDDTLTGGNA